MKQAIMLTLALLLTVKVAAAQDTFPSDPSAIFTDAVEVVSVETYVTPEDISPSVDDTTRTIRVYDREVSEWREFAYPDGVTHIASLSPRSDGTWLVYASEPDYGHPAVGALILDLRTREYSPVEAVCEQQIRALPNEGVWRYVQVERDLLVCFTETGERYGPLDVPDHLAWLNNIPIEGDFPPVPSPDGQWLLLGGYAADENGFSPYLEIYSYRPSTGELNHLGHLDYFPYLSTYLPQVRDWVSNTQGLIQEYSDGEFAPDEFYIFDVAIPESLELAVVGWMYDFYENPSRYEYMTTHSFLEWKTGSVWNEHQNCIFTLYDARGFRTYDLGYDCAPRIGLDYCPNGAMRVGDDYLFIRVEREDQGYSTLTYLNTETGELSDLLRNAGTTMINVSPDGRYLTLLDGVRLGNYSMGCEPDAYDSSTANAHLRVVDLQIPQIVYETGYSGGSVNWLDNNRLLLMMGWQSRFYDVGNGDISSYSLDGRMELITFGEDAIRVNAIYSGTWSLAALASQGNQIIAQQGYGGDYFLFSLPALDDVPITNSGIGHDYSLTFEWMEDGLIAVEAYSRDPYRLMATYTIRIRPEETP